MLKSSKKLHKHLDLKEVTPKDKTKKKKIGRVRDIETLQEMNYIEDEYEEVNDSNSLSDDV